MRGPFFWFTQYSSWAQELPFQSNMALFGSKTISFNLIQQAVITSLTVPAEQCCICIDCSMPFVDNIIQLTVEAA